MDLDRYKREMDKLRVGIQSFEKQLEDQQKRHNDAVALKDGLANLETFAATVARGLENLTFEERQALLRLLVERATILENKLIRIELAIPLDGPNLSVGLRPQGGDAAVYGGSIGHGRGLTRFIAEFRRSRPIK